MAASRAAREEPLMEILESGEETLHLRLAGRLEATTLGDLWERVMERLRAARPRSVVVEASGVIWCDSAGVTLLADMELEQKRRGGAFELRGFPSHFQRMLEMARKAPTCEPPPPPPPRDFFVLVGRRVMGVLVETVNMITWSGEILASLAGAVLRPQRVRWRDTLRVMQTAGVDAFPVTSLVCFLLGLILAYQTAGGFKDYGAEIYMADMLGKSITRELGPLMTAIVLTARSSSAFAAEIGTMRVNEEVDALTTMGIPPVRFLVTPRIIAAVVMTPILTVYANIMALVGGAFVWVLSLDMTLSLYHVRLLEAVNAGDVIGGLVKAFFFGVLIAGMGCIRGLQTRGGPLAVGAKTTSAVVSGIVGLALLDMVFAVVFFQLGI